MKGIKCKRKALEKPSSQPSETHEREISTELPALTWLSSHQKPAILHILKGGLTSSVVASQGNFWVAWKVFLHAGRWLWLDYFWKKDQEMLWINRKVLLFYLIQKYERQVKIISGGKCHFIAIHFRQPLLLVSQSLSRSNSIGYRTLPFTIPSTFIGWQSGYLGKIISSLSKK